MMPRKRSGLTITQVKILELFEANDAKGLEPPTTRKIMEYLGTRSKSWVQDNLEVLVKKGFLKRKEKTITISGYCLVK